MVELGFNFVKEKFLVRSIVKSNRCVISLYNILCNQNGDTEIRKATLRYDLHFLK